MLRDVSSVDTSTTILGQPSALPLAFAPTGFTRVMGTEGEIAVGNVAKRIGIPHALSTMGTTSIEHLAKEVGDADRWFQLYVWRDRGASQALVERAKAAGFTALLLTVDTHVSGDRMRDVRNGFTTPPALTLKTLGDMAVHPALVVRHAHDRAAALREHRPTSAARCPTWSGGSWTRRWTSRTSTGCASIWDGPLVVKGVMTAEGRAPGRRPRRRRR